MATKAKPYPEADNDTEAEAPKASERKLKEVHERALARFNAVSGPQREIRDHALLCRRFISVPGAMWEGAWGDQFANSIKVEIDKLSKGVEKIVSDYRANRIVPDFRPAIGGDQMTADTLDGIHRADGYHFKSQQARDNAFEEAAAGGYGAYRLCNDYAEPDDENSDDQRVNPGSLIADADQRVYFDGNSQLYDKADAEWAIILTADTREAFEEDWPDCAVDWPTDHDSNLFDWFPPDIVIKAEYYEVEKKREKLLIFTHKISGQEMRTWESDTDAAEIADMAKAGFTKEAQSRDRKRVHKYLMSGAEVLDDCGQIAGPNIPIVPVYGRRWFVDNIERFRGHVSKLMDAQRIYNGRVSKLSETDALSPREKPIFLAEQLPPNLRELWALQETERHPYALVNPVIDPATGQIVAMGPIGKIEPPTLNQVTALLLQIAASDLAEETEDGADEVVANTSAAAMDIAATRVDIKSAINLDNMRQSVQREGEIYLGMANEIYADAGRVLETMTEDGSDGTATLQQPITDANGAFLIRNNFQRGRYKVIVDVTEATTTRRDKAVKSSLATAQMAMAAQDVELAQAAVITAVMNQDGEGMDNLKRFARQRGIQMGLVEPNEDEKQKLAAAAAAKAQQPDPGAILVAAQAKALGAAAAKDLAGAGKVVADTQLSRAKTTDTLANAAKAHAETLLMGGDPEAEPAEPEPPAEPAQPAGQPPEQEPEAPPPAPPPLQHIPAPPGG